MASATAVSRAARGTGIPSRRWRWSAPGDRGDPPGAALRHEKARVLVAADVAAMDATPADQRLRHRACRGAHPVRHRPGPRLGHRRSYFPGGFTGYLYDRLARFHIEEEDTLTAQLATLGYAPADVDTAILSHLHEDHIGGLPSWGVQTCWSRRPSGSSSRGSAQSSGGSFASTSRSRDCSGARPASSQPATQGWHPSPSRWMSWKTVLSSWCRFRVTRPGRCPC
jgi:hypothetical protein